MLVTDSKRKFVKKEWGGEIFLVNEESYCGKVLILNEQYRSSFHKHEIKKETFYILDGFVLLELEQNKYKMNMGDSITIYPGQKHRFTGIRNSKIVEISTQDFDFDSYRMSKSEKISDDEFESIILEIMGS